MKINTTKTTKVNFNAFVNETKNGYKYLSQKGSYITDKDGNVPTVINPDIYYNISGKGLTRDYLSKFAKGEKLAIEGILFPTSIKEDVWKDGSTHYTILIG